MSRAHPSTLLFAAAWLLASAPASAQFNVRFWEREYTDDERKELEDGFNLEECENDMVMTFEYTYSGSLGAGELYVYIGSGCDDKTNRDEGRCYPVIENRSLSTSGYIDIHPAPVVEPTTEETPTCSEAEGASDVYFFVMQSDAAETIVYRQQVTIDYDTLPPDPPTDIRADYGENMISVKWDVADPDYPEDWDNFYVVCWGGEHTPEVPDPEPDGTTADAVADAPPDVTDDTLAPDVPDVVEDDGFDVPDDVLDAAEDAPIADSAIPDTGAGADPDTGDGVTEDGCPVGGFEEGDEFAESYACSGELGSTTRSYELRGLSNGVAYKASVVAVDSFGNESVIGAIVCATPEEVDDFWEVYKKAGGEDDGGFCFVATAAYGDEDHPAVVWLRAYRDEVLLALPVGRTMVDGYYRTSPPLARWLRDRPAVRVVARAGLWPAVGAAYVAVQASRRTGPAAWVLVALALCAGVCAGLARRARGRRG
jgi:hypothetical protein